MKKTIITILLVITSVMFISPINAKALSVDSAISSVSENIYVLEGMDDINDIIDDGDQQQDCTGANSIFGDPNDPISVAWLIQLMLNIIKVAGPILVILLSSIDFIRVIVKSDDEAMAKAQKKLIMRLILAVLLFLIPVIVQVLLGIFGITSDPTCGIQ